MTMAPSRKKRGFWLEIIFVSILLFLLLGSRSQSSHSTGARSDLKSTFQRGLVSQPGVFK